LAVEDGSHRLSLEEGGSPPPSSLSSEELIYDPDKTLTPEVEEFLQHIYTTFLRVRGSSRSSSSRFAASA